MGRFIRSWMVAAALAGILAVAGNASAATGTPVWSTPGPYDSGLATDPGFSSIACPSVGNCVAVGGVDVSGAPSANGSLASTPVFAVESGGTWGQTLSVFQLPPNASTSAGASDELESVSCSGASSCVAVGRYSNSMGGTDAMAASINLAYGHAVVGAVTEIVPSAPAAAEGSQAATLHGVSCTATACEAVGQYVDNSGSTQPMLASQSAGGSWSAVTVAAPADATNKTTLDSISCPSAGGACEAVGNYADASGDAYPWTLQINGGTPGSPQLVTLPAAASSWVPPDGLAVLASASLTEVSCPSAGACTAAGTYSSTGSTDYALPIVNGTPGTVTNLDDPKYGFGVDGLYCSDASDCLVGLTEFTGLGTFPSYFAAEDGGVWGPGPAGLQAGFSGPGIAIGPIASFGCANAMNCTAYVANPSHDYTGPSSFITLAPPVADSPPPTVGTPTTEPSEPATPIAKLMKVSLKGIHLAVTIGCSDAACKGSLALTAIEHLTGKKVTAVTARVKAPSKSGKTKPKTKTITFATGSYTVSAGKSKTVLMTLTRAATKLLAARHTLPARLALTPAGAKKATVTKTVALKAATNKK